MAMTSPTYPDSNQDVTVSGADPTGASDCTTAFNNELATRITIRNRQVVGSNPTGRSKKIKGFFLVQLLKFVRGAYEVP
jgi:hypothetical protein